MATYRTATVAVKQNICCYFKCHYCNNTNLILDEIISESSSTTTYAPFSKEKRTERDRLLHENAEINAHAKSNLTAILYEKKVNEHRNTNGMTLQGCCKTCGKRQAWTNIPEISMKFIIVVMVSTMVFCLLLNNPEEKTMRTMWCMLLTSLPLIYVIHSGLTAFRNQKIMDKLSIDYYPILLTKYNAKPVLERIKYGQPVPGIKNEKNPRVNARNILWNMLRCSCLILGCVCLVGLLKYDYELTIKVDYKPYITENKNGEFVKAEISKALQINSFIALDEINYDEYYLFEMPDGKLGIVHIDNWDRPEYFSRGGNDEKVFEEPITIYGTLEYIDDVKVLKASSKMVKEIYVYDYTKLGPGWIMTYLAILFFVTFFVLQIRFNINKAKGGN